MSKNKIFTGVDLVKMFAAIGVVAIHTNLPFFNILGRLGVPFFAIVSSVFFFNKFNKVSTWNMQIKILFNFIKRIFLLYFIWQCLYIPLSALEIKKFLSQYGNINIHSILICILYFFFPALYNSKNVDVTFDLNGWGPSWYLLAVMVGIPIFVFCLKIFKSNKWVLGIICICLEIYFILVNEFEFIFKISPLLTHTFIRLFIYFFIGYIFSLYFSKVNLNNKYKIRLGILALLMLFLFMLENIIIHYIGGIYTSEEVITTVPTSVLLSLVSFNWNPHISNSIHIRNISTFLYCVQIWPLVIMQRVLEIYHLGNVSHLILFVTVMIISTMLYLVYAFLRRKGKFKFLKFMV